MVKNIMKEFEEIAHTGGKITFANGQAKYVHSNPHHITMYDLAVSFNGIILGRASFDRNNSSLPDPSITVMMASDKEGFFGYVCPGCQQYFRGYCLPEVILCPYCLYEDNGIAFLTKNQLQYIDLYLDKLHEHFNTGEDVCIDCDEIINQLDNNSIKLSAYEVRRQRTIVCEKCKTKFDIIGVFASCPACGHRNNLSQFREDINSIRNQTKNPGVKLNRLLNSAVEDCVGMGSDIQSVLEKNIPLCSLSRKEIRKIDFQRIIETNDVLVRLYGLRLFKDDHVVKNFFTLIFQKRHLIAHKRGVVDQKYLDKTNDVTVRLGQEISISMEELNKFLDLLEEETSKFFEQFSSLVDDCINKS
jgi:hypothetical protein